MQSPHYIGFPAIVTCGIEGNEFADDLAKEALTQPRAEVVLPISRQQAGKSAMRTAQGIADAMLQQDGT